MDEEYDEDQEYELEYEEPEEEIDWNMTGKKERSDEEEELLGEIDRLSAEATLRQKRAEQKAEVKRLKKQVRKMKVKETVAPVTDVISPVASEAKRIGGGFVRLGKAFVESSKERHDGEEGVTPTIGTGMMASSVREGKPDVFTFSRGGGTDLTLGKSDNKFDFSLGKNRMEMTTRKGGMGINGVLSSKTEYDFSLGKNRANTGRRVKPVKRIKTKKARPIKKGKKRKR
jgi:hypothetical protein